MPTLLRLDSSADWSSSRSRQLSAAFTEVWAGTPGCKVVERDLAAAPLPHLPDASLHWPPRLRAADAHPPIDAEQLQERLIGELLAADVLLIGAPMYNYSLPSSLKAWIDYVHVPGVTAPFDQPSQPMKGRPAVIVSARGAAYDEGSGPAELDLGTKLLEAILGRALGMELIVITTDLTLAESVPLLADQIDRAREQLAAALELTRRTAEQLARIQPEP